MDGDWFGGVSSINNGVDGLPPHWVDLGVAGDGGLPGAVAEGAIAEEGPVGRGGNWGRKNNWRRRGAAGGAASVEP